MIQRIVIGALLLATPAFAQRLAFDGPGVELSGNGTELVKRRGLDAIGMSTGAATWKDVRFEDGTIEFDMETIGVRSFIYLTFRMQSEGEHEELYFRAHKPMHPDFIQYSPVYRGESSWQLYHDERYTAAAPMPPNEWVHVRVAVSGSQAAVFVGDTTEPQLVVPLERRSAPGFVALRSFVPAGPVFDSAATHFANLELSPGDASYDFGERAEPDVPAGIVTAWAISEPFVPGEGAIETLVQPSQWKRMNAEDSGLVLPLKHVARPEGARRASILARMDLRSEGSRTAKFNLGYSDEVSVFLNGRLLFYADDSYSFNLPRREGLIGLEQSTLYLPLEPGDNEVVLAVTDGFGGWGWMGRLHPSEGVSRIEPQLAPSTARPYRRSSIR